MDPGGRAGPAARAAEACRGAPARHGGQYKVPDEPRQKDEYQIILITKALDPDGFRLQGLPNPFSREGAPFYRVMGQGMQYRFKLDEYALIPGRDALRGCHRPCPERTARPVGSVRRCPHATRPTAKPEPAPSSRCHTTAAACAPSARGRWRCGPCRECEREALLIR